MIAGEFHNGSGLGNQLHRYVATRVLALDKGYKWGMLNRGNFKGSDFMQIDLGESPYSSLFAHHFNEKKIIENNIDVREYDPEINSVLDFTIIDGEFQDEKYWKHRAKEVREWLKVEPLDMPKDVCVINFRGGEYVGIPELYLTKDYWDLAIKYKLEKGVRNFEVHTDDVKSARFMLEYSLPAGTPFISDMALNWRSIRYAHHLILSNSSFAILPAWLNENVKEIVAPMFWARRNLGVWALPQNHYIGERKNWLYI